MDLIKAGIICKMCGTVLPEAKGQETSCMDCEEKLVLSSEGVDEGDETVDVQNIISGPYLTAACVMVAEQIINSNPEIRPQTKEAFINEAAIMMRYHAPIAYAFFFQQFGGKDVLPTGTTDVILDLIWKNPLTASYLGGKNSGIYIPGQS